MLFLKPLKVLHTLDPDWLPSDRARREVAGALGIVRQDLSASMKAVGTKQSTPLCRVDEIPAYVHGVLLASRIAAH